MSKTLRLDTGIEEYDINGRAVFYINPTDPGLFDKVLEFADQMETFQTRHSELYKRVLDEAARKKEAEMAEEQNAQIGEAIEPEINLNEEDGYPDVSDASVEVIQALRELDAEIKQRLRDVFGLQNDFDAIFDHKSALALTNSGANILDNFLEMITPIITSGAGERSEQAAKLQAARAKATANRTQRRQMGMYGKKNGWQ